MTALPALARPDERERDAATLRRAVADHRERCESRPIERMADYECCPFRASHLERATS